MKDAFTEDIATSKFHFSFLRDTRDSIPIVSDEKSCIEIDLTSRVFANECVNSDLGKIHKTLCAGFTTKLSSVYMYFMLYYGYFFQQETLGHS